MREKLYTVREASHFLGISEKDVIDLSEKGTIAAYKVGGIYLRFKKENLEAVKDKIKPAEEGEGITYSLQERTSDFFYYNDFYIFSLLIMSVLVYLIFNL